MRPVVPPKWIVLNIDEGQSALCRPTSASRITLRNGSDYKLNIFTRTAQEGTSIGFRRAQFQQIPALLWRRLPTYFPLS